MGNYNIAKESFRKLDKRDIVEYIADKIPFVGLRLKMERLKEKRQVILCDLEKEIFSGSRDINMVDIVMVDKIMVAHNQENINNVQGNHYLFGAFCGVSGLIGIGYALGNYFAN